MVGWLAYSVVTCRKYGHCWISLFFKHEAGTLYHDIFYIFIYFTSSNLRHPVHTRQSMVFNQRFFQGKQLLPILTWSLRLRKRLGTFTDTFSSRWTWFSVFDNYDICQFSGIAFSLIIGNFWSKTNWHLD